MGTVTSLVDSSWRVRLSGALFVALLMGACDSGGDGDDDAILDDGVGGGSAPISDPEPGTDPDADPEPDPEPEPDPAPLPPSVQWEMSYDGSHAGRGVIAGDEQTVVTTSRDADGNGLLTAISPSSGIEKFQFSDVAIFCTPAMSPGGDVLVHLDRTTAIGGRDNTSDVALIDANSGDILDQWAPDDGQLQNCSTDELLVTPSGTLITANRSLVWSLDISGTQLTPLWNRNLAGEAADDAVFAGRRPSFYDDAVVLGERFYSVSLEDRGDGSERAVTLYQFDAGTGETLGRLDIPLRALSGLHVAGPDHVLLVGQSRADSENTSVLVSGVGPDADPNMLTIDWTRGFFGDLDGVTRGISSSFIALQENALASWSETDATRGVIEFDLATGLLNFASDASSFSNNDSITALPNGGYSVFPFGGNFVESVDGDGQASWFIESVEGYGSPVAMRLYGETLVLVASRVGGGWGFVGVGPITADTE